MKITAVIVDHKEAFSGDELVLTILQVGGQKWLEIYDPGDIDCHILVVSSDPLTWSQMGELWLAGGYQICSQIWEGTFEEIETALETTEGET